MAAPMVNTGPQADNRQNKSHIRYRVRDGLSLTVEQQLALSSAYAWLCCEAVIHARSAHGSRAAAAVLARRARDLIAAFGERIP